MPVLAQHPPAEEIDKLESLIRLKRSFSRVETAVEGTNAGDIEVRDRQNRDLVEIDIDELNRNAVISALKNAEFDIDEQIDSQWLKMSPATGGGGGYGIRVCPAITTNFTLSGTSHASNKK
jgi:hypothetical protein